MCWEIMGERERRRRIEMRKNLNMIIALIRMAVWDCTGGAGLLSVKL